MRGGGEKREEGEGEGETDKEGERGEERERTRERERDREREREMRPGDLNTWYTFRYNDRLGVGPIYNCPNSHTSQCANFPIGVHSKTRVCKFCGP